MLGLTAREGQAPQIEPPAIPAPHKRRLLISELTAMLTEERLGA